MKLNPDVILVVEVRPTAVDDEVTHLHVEDLVRELGNRMVHGRFLDELIFGRFCIVNAFELRGQMIKLVLEISSFSLVCK